MAVLTFGLLFAKYYLPEMHVVALIRGVAAWQCLIIDGLGCVGLGKDCSNVSSLGWRNNGLDWVGYFVMKNGPTTTRETAHAINAANYDRNSNRITLLLKPRLHDTNGCQTGWTTGWMFVYTMQPVVQPVVQPVWQPVVSCERGLTATEVSVDLLLKGIISCSAPPCTENTTHVTTALRS